MSSQEVDAMQESFGRKAKQGALEKGQFPEQKGAMFPVLDPDSDARFSWDCYLMVLIFYVMLVTPFQLSFTNAPTHPKDTFTLGSPSGYNKYIGLWVSNIFVDIAFICDLVLAFNTGFFDHNEGEWVVSRDRIARGARPRIMARIAARNTMRAGQQAVLKYIAILFFLLHWAACAVRMIGFLTLDGCHAKDNLGDDPAMTCGETILAKYWNRGIWAHLTMDTLNNWFDESQLPVHLRKQLREYMGLAEKSWTRSSTSTTAVLALSTHVSTKFFMTGDVMVHANQSLNTEMFIISTGRALVWGDKSANPCSRSRKSVYDTIGDDICMLTVAGRSPTPRLYSVRSTTTTECSVLDGPPFVETVGNGQFSAFYRGMRKYGAWQLLRYAILRSVRLKQRLGTPFEASLPALGAGVRARRRQGAADAAQVLLKKVLATDAGKLEGPRRGRGATLCRSLEAVKQILADPAAAALAEQEAVEKLKI
ncbi:voltage-gated potassium channel [Aureococcus anophagefferens]|nr:voltage-gated potassium channel [Aureococcus anophagefferens]